MFKLALPELYIGQLSRCSLAGPYSLTAHLLTLPHSNYTYVCVPGVPGWALLCISVLKYLQLILQFVQTACVGYR